MHAAKASGTDMMGQAKLGYRHEVGQGKATPQSRLDPLTLSGSHTKEPSQPLGHIPGIGGGGAGKWGRRGRQCGKLLVGHATACLCWLLGCYGIV